MCDCDHSHPSPLDRRSLFRAGAGVVTVGALGTVDRAAAADRPRTRRYVFKGEFRDPTTPDWHYLPFKVPAGVSKIHVSYDFNPTDTGLGLSLNVVDIGIFDGSGHDLGNAEGFRGWSGGARREFTIKRGHSTPGYLAGPLTPGTWHILLGPYQIVGAGTPYKVVVELTFGEMAPVFVPQPAPQEVPGTGPGWYRGDLHLHTIFSDGKRNQPQLIAAAQAAGLDFIGSSDHNTSAATYHWGKHVPDGFLVINGEEVTTRSGHWLAMGLPPMTWIDWRFRAADGELGRFTDKVRSLGGLAIAAHPFNPVPSIRWEHGYDYAHIDAIELWNGPWTGDDQSTLNDWHRKLVAGTFVPGVGNSDSHTDSQTVGLAQTVYRLGSLSAAEVVSAIKGGHAWIAESSAVDLTFVATLGEKSAECGDHLGAAAEDVVTVTLEASGVPGAFAVLWGASGPLPGGFAVADDAGALTLELSVPASEQFVRAEIGRPNPTVPSPVEGTPIQTMVALTNPVFLT
jgi:hypothetical protein